MLAVATPRDSPVFCILLSTGFSTSFCIESIQVSLLYESTAEQ